jgi:hypothetical protein
MVKTSWRALWVASCFALCACGGGDTVTVSGKLLKGNAPYSPPSGQLVSVTLVGMDVHDAAGKKLPGGESYTAEVDQSKGTFTVNGPERAGIPLGKYRVAVTQKMTREAFHVAHPQPKKGVDREMDMLNNQFSMDKSPLTCEVKRGEEIVLDLASTAK